MIDSPVFPKDLSRAPEAVKRSVAKSHSGWVLYWRVLLPAMTIFPSGCNAAYLLPSLYLLKSTVVVPAEPKELSGLPSGFRRVTKKSES